MIYTEGMAMIGKCASCHRVRNTQLPSGYDSEWLSRGNHPPVDWYCPECYWRELAQIEHKPLEIEIYKTYLMPYRHIIPFLATIAFIIMMCAEIAAHTM